jgi:hypothetical protein
MKRLFALVVGIATLLLFWKGEEQQEDGEYSHIDDVR